MTATAPPPAPPAGTGLLRRIALYGASRGVTEGFFAARGLLLAFILGPAAYGIWALLRLGVRYAGFAGLVANRGLELELVREHTDGVAPGASRTAGAALAYVLAVFGTGAALAIGASLLVRDPRHALLLRGFGAVIVAEQVYAYALICLRARAEIGRYAALELSHAAAQVVCTCTFALLWGLPGAFAGLVAASGFGVLVARRLVTLRPAVDRAALARVLRVGLPLVTAMAMATVLATVDQWIVAGMAGPAALGHYAFAAAVAGLAATAAWIVRTVVLPDVYGRAHAGGADRALRTHLEEAVVPFARLAPVLLGAAAFFIGPALALVAPQYLEAVAPARLFIFSGAAAGIVSLASLGVVAAERQRALPLIALGAVVVNAAASVGALTLGWGLAGVAAASLVAQGGYAAAVVGLVLHAAGTAQVGGRLVRVLAPLAWCAGVSATLFHFLPGRSAAPVALGLGLYLTAVAPLLPVIRRDLRIVRRA